MKENYQWSKQIVKLGFLLMMGASMGAEAGLLGFGSTSWKEEVLLHDGTKLIVERSQSHGGRGEIGQSPIKEHSVTFTLPATNKTVTWQDEYSEDVGHSNFDLLALHILNSTPYIAASPYGCLAYNKWGRPNPPYVFFKHDGKAWQRVQASEFPVAFKEINLVINASAHEKELVSLGTASPDQIKKFNSSLKQPELKTTLRETVKPGTEGSSVNCIELVLYKGSWIMPNDPVMRRRLDQQTK